MATQKQKKAAIEIVETRGNVSEAMRRAGYDDTTAKNPKNLTESKGWKELLKTYLSDESLAKKHQELLNAVSIERFSFAIDDTDDAIRRIVNETPGLKLIYLRYAKGDSNKIAYIEIADNNARKNALEMAYKLKGSFAPEKSLNVNVDVTTIDDKALDSLAERINQQTQNDLHKRADQRGNGATANSVDQEVQPQERKGTTDTV